jgi:hypothetical protein
MRLRGSSFLTNALPILMRIVAVAAILSGCDGRERSSSDYAPISIVGKTLRMGGWLFDVSFATESEGHLSFTSRVMTCAESGPSTYSYSAEGPDGPRLVISYGYTQKSTGHRIYNETTGELDLTLNFASVDTGTAEGSFSYAFVDYESDERSSADNVAISAPFVLIGL